MRRNERGNHTDIPWGPVVPHETYDGYRDFCKRQKERLHKATAARFCEPGPGPDIDNEGRHNHAV